MKNQKKLKMNRSSKKTGCHEGLHRMHNATIRREERKWQKNIRRSNSLIFFQFGEKYESTYISAAADIKWDKFRELHYRHFVKMLQANKKEKILKKHERKMAHHLQRSARKIKNITHHQKQQKIKRRCDDIFKFLKNRKCQPRVPEPAKLSFKYKIKVKLLPDKQKSGHFSWEETPYQLDWVRFLRIKKKGPRRQFEATSKAKSRSEDKYKIIKDSINTYFFAVLKGFSGPMI